MVRLFKIEDTVTTIEGENEIGVLTLVERTVHLTGNCENDIAMCLQPMQGISRGDRIFTRT